jgi:hypothetical protein
MKEFLLLIRTEGDHLESLPPAEQQKHIQRVGSYIGKLVQDGKLKGAQPLEMEGVMLQMKNGKLKDGPFNETKEVIAGYFLIEADSIEQATEIAKANPVFEDQSARIEIRPVKKMEGIN